MADIINAPMTRKEFLTLPVELRRKILKRQVVVASSELKPPKPGTLCTECMGYDDCDMRDASQFCSGFKKKTSPFKPIDF